MDNLIFSAIFEVMKNSGIKKKKKHTTLIFGHLGNGLAKELLHALSLIWHILRLVYHQNQNCANCFCSSKNISGERKIITKCYIKYFVHNF